jgi:hypothetical protein
MSLSAIPQETFKVLDPRIDVLKERVNVITKSGNRINWLPYKTNSTGGNTLVFNVVPPSRNTFVGRKMYIESSVSITFRCTTPDDASALGFEIVSANADAPRSFPLSRALSSATAQIGNANVSMQTGNVIDLLLRSMKREDLAEYQDGCPTAQDNAQTYEAYAATQGLNVLGSYSQSVCKDDFSRGYFDVFVEPATNTGGGKVWTQRVEFKVFEPVLLSPFVFSKINHSSLIGLTNINLTYNFGNKDMVWSGTYPTYTNAGNTVKATNLTMDVQFAPLSNTGSGVSDAKLWVEFISPSTLMEIPKQIAYSYYDVQSWTTNGGTNTKYGTMTTINSDNVQLKVVPKLIFVAVRPTQGLKKYYQPDAYFRIENASVNFANTTGLLASASPYALYQMCKKNGLNYEFRQWHGKFGSLNKGALTGAAIPSGCGSVLIINPAEDLGLNDELAAGVMGAYNLQIQLQVENINPGQTADTTEYEMVIVTVNDGQLSIDVAGTGAATTQLGCVSEADVLKAQVRSDIDYNEMNGLVGSGWFDKVLSMGRKIPGVVHAAAKVLPQISDGMKSMGLGHGAGHGGQLIGSAIASKKSLKERLKDH